ncbi:hypothetical protein [Kibdelosporangium phytohabitans]|uniref:Uncharacterized protein n=1 Tax=Kibdelosporangium phytohabitans TaxID=860235 RepID=A0A0N9HRI0_9PSEU|nr:hypothetical protein [Kibdelosporangium phytohabitans]ALG07461.1 hypothetical protein AOZ06_11515 [Kibdelosporangium phytohabitans]MBE1471635.1 hypothetical protein [Kibdelosporangium phytohabitans]
MKIRSRWASRTTSRAANSPSTSAGGEGHADAQSVPVQVVDAEQLDGDGTDHRSGRGVVRVGEALGHERGTDPAGPPRGYLLNISVLPYVEHSDTFDLI